MSRKVTIGPAFTSYLGVSGYVHTSKVEKDPKVHQLYHTWDPIFGRRYHLDHSSHFNQSNLVEGAMSNIYNPNQFLDKDKRFSLYYFHAYVWENRLEIGAKLSDAQKAEFPSWIQWKYDSEQVNDLKLRHPDGTVCGKIGYDSERPLVIKYNSDIGRTEDFINKEGIFKPGMRLQQSDKPSHILQPVHKTMKWEGPEISPINSQDSDSNSSN